MGKRNEWTLEQIEAYIKEADGNLTLAARNMNEDRPSAAKVTRQNLQWWMQNASEDIETGVHPATAVESADVFELTRKLRHQQNENNKLRREARTFLDSSINRKEVLDGIEAAVSASVDDYKLISNYEDFEPKAPNGKKLTVELLLSDLQIGKLMGDYDSEVCQRRVQEWMDVVLDRLIQYARLGYKVERIVLAILGDIIESDKKHSNSARACDIGTADQMKIAIDILANKIIETLASLHIPLDVVMVTGNHDHDDHGLNMFMPGREHLSWPVYHAVRMITQARGDLDVSFDIPVGSFTTLELYGQTILYEHGVRVPASEPGMKKHVGNRIDQLKKFIHMCRIGDKHNICRFNNDRFVVNGAFFGDSRAGEEYSGIAGYDGEPAQLMFAHVQRDNDKRSSIFDSLAIQLGHVE